MVDIFDATEICFLEQLMRKLTGREAILKLAQDLR